MTRRRTIDPNLPAFRQIPASWAAVFFAGVFCTFAPLGLLVSSGLTPERPLLGVVIVLTLGGAIAVCWAAASTISWWFAIAAVAFTAMIIGLHTSSIGPSLGVLRGDFSPVSISLIVLIVVGYVCFVVFISKQGRQTIELQNEMRLARTIHDALVPRIEHSGGGLEVFGASFPSADMGGDLIDLVVRPGETDVYLGDVSGHGVRAGVVMGMLKASIRTRLLRSGDLGSVLTDLNEVLHALTTADMFATFACIRFDERAGKAHAAVAGHHAIVRVAPDGATTLIENQNLPLGVSDGEALKEFEFEPSRGELIACYTDGLSETMDRNGRQLGHEAIHGLLARERDRPLAAIAEAVMGLAAAHGRQDDDRTLLLVRVGDPLQHRTSPA